MIHTTKTTDFHGPVGFVLLKVPREVLTGERAANFACF